MLHEITGDADYSRISKLSYLIFDFGFNYIHISRISQHSCHICFQAGNEHEEEGLNILLDGSFTFFDVIHLERLEKL